MSLDLWITSNSPGEVSTWVAGVVPLIRQLRPHWTIRLALVPCPYASGAEKRVAQQIEGLNEVFSPWETFRWWLGLKSLATPRAPRGAVVFLGGDPWHALLLKRKLGYPALGYFERPSPWSRWFDGTALAYSFSQVPPSSVVVGNLMVDQVSWNAFTGAPRRVGLFPGSRPWQLRLTLGAYLVAAGKLQQMGLECLLVQSPFVQDEDLRRALERPFPLGLPTSPARVESQALVLPDGTSLARRAGGGGMQDLDLAITLPGTNTAELACAGVPYLVTLHPLAFLGGGGLPGLIERLPLPPRWKVPLRKRKLRRVGFTALPNQVAGRMIVPEIMLDRSVDPIVDQIRRWVEEPDEVQRIRAELRGIMGQPGARQRLADWIVERVDAEVGR